MFDCLSVYASMGWPIFPCHSSGPKAKAPLTEHGFKDATCSLKQIEEWHKQYPGCVWGGATTAERGVADIDPRNGGAESLARLEAEHGPLPLTPKDKTGGNGFHYWLRFPPGTACGKPFPGIDRKAEGGYVILPPSKIDIPEHQGRAYTWVDGCRPWEIGMAVAPGWLLSTKPTPKPKASAEAPADDPWVVKAACADLLTHPGSPEGERRRVLCQLVGVHLARGDSEASVYAMAEAWAARCAPPIVDPENWTAS